MLVAIGAIKKLRLVLIAGFYCMTTLIDLKECFALNNYRIIYIA